MIANSFRRSLEFVDSVSPCQDRYDSFPCPTPHLVSSPLHPSLAHQYHIIHTMAVLETLPDELFAQILEDLPQSDLASTSCVSRRLHNISQPLLYREPHLHITDHHPTSFNLFFGTLYNPTLEFLGTNVRNLTIDWKSHNIRDDDDQLIAAARAHPMLGDKAVSKISLLVLLLPLMPRLQALHLPLLHHPRSISYWLNPLRPDTLPPTLRHFTYEWPAPIDFITLENLLTILHLPHIRSIVIRDISNQSFPDDTKTLSAAAGTSSLTHLTIRSDSTDLQILHPILRIPRALTHFTYQPVLVCGSFSFVKMGLALRPLQHSLTSLLLDFRKLRANWQRRRPTTIGSLRDWAALRTVTCTLDVLIASDSHGIAMVLPPGIREVDILNHDEIPLGEAVKEVVALLAAAEMVPGLHRVRVYAGRMKSKRLRRRLRKACWAVGVAFDDESICERPGWMNQ